MEIDSDIFEIRLLAEKLKQLKAMLQSRQDLLETFFHACAMHLAES